jgi:hypothetical protein
MQRTSEITRRNCGAIQLFANSVDNRGRIDSVTATLSTEVAPCKKCALRCKQLEILATGADPEGNGHAFPGTMYVIRADD